MDARLIIWIPLFPLIGFVLNGLFGRIFPKWLVSAVACCSIGASMVVSFAVFRLLGLDEKAALNANLIADWIFSEDLSIPIAFTVDRLSAVMIMVVSGVSFLIHVYSIGYMGHDGSYSRYFAYLNLFCFFMLLLVLSDNLLLLFVGWEGVGLCSYLLIGFWFEDEEKAKAGKKAFIVNRIGDFGFILGIFFIFYFFGTLDFKELVAAVSEFARLNPQAIEGVATLVAVLLFIGAIGKSAQIPLYVWLPDAMAGPTPVSALIHAATMVTAGVYMIGRLYFIYDYSVAAKTIVLAVGTVTAIYAATIALVQNDIKKVLAYSTISQLGYMFMAMGLGAYAAGIFHLSTHAFFKALLFLGAGSVIHTLSGEQDIRKMGGLKNYLVLTTMTFAVAVAAISGFPLFSGWFSKDEILLKAAQSDNPFGMTAWILGLITAGLTAFYMLRLFVLVFMGTTKVKKEDLPKLHESPPSMTVPLFILAVLSLAGGGMGIKSYLEGYFPKAGHAAQGFLSDHFYHGLIVTMVSLGAIAFTVYLYTKRMDIVSGLQKRFAWIHGVLSRKYMVDELYQAVFINPYRSASHVMAWTDKWVVDGFVNLSAYFVKGMGFAASRLQTGLVQAYAFFFILGLMAILGYLFWIG